jgi:hypothetical protein
VRRRELVLCLLCGCTATLSSTDGPIGGACLTLYPALRIESGCPDTPRVFLNGRELPPDPRVLHESGATIFPWPSWAHDGQVSVAQIGTAETMFIARPFECQIVEVTCP